MTKKVNSVQWEIVDEKALVAEANTSVQEAKELLIDCQDMYDVAADLLRQVKARAKQLDEQRKTITKPLDEAKKAAMAQFKPALERLAQAEEYLKAGMARFAQEQERQRRIALAEAEKKAREEQAAREAEARRAAEEAERLAQEAAGDESKALHAAVAAEEAAAAAEAAAMPVAPLAEVVAKPKAEGVASVKLYVAEIVDPAALLAHIAANPELMHLIEFKQGALNRLASSLKTALNLPGVRLVEQTSIRARAA